MDNPFFLKKYVFYTKRYEIQVSHVYVLCYFFINWGSWLAIMSYVISYIDSIGMLIILFSSFYIIERVS